MGKRGFMSVHHVRGAVAHQQHIQPRLIENTREAVVVRGKHRDPATLRLHLREPGGGDPRGCRAFHVACFQSTSLGAFALPYGEHVVGPLGPDTVVGQDTPRLPRPSGRAEKPWSSPPRFSNSITTLSSFKSRSTLNQVREAADVDAVDRRNGHGPSGFE